MIRPSIWDGLTKSDLIERAPGPRSQQLSFALRVCNTWKLMARFFPQKHNIRVLGGWFLTNEEVMNECIVVLLYILL